MQSVIIDRGVGFLLTGDKAPHTFAHCKQMLVNFLNAFPLEHVEKLRDELIVSETVSHDQTIASLGWLRDCPECQPYYIAGLDPHLHYAMLNQRPSLDQAHVVTSQFDDGMLKSAIKRLSGGQRG